MMLAELPPELLFHTISFLTRLPGDYHLAVGISEKQELIPDLSSINALSQTNTFFHRTLNKVLYDLCASVGPLGGQALVFAVTHGLENTLDKCVAAGISLDTEFIFEPLRDRLSLLHVAAATGTRAIVVKLLEMYGEDMMARVHAWCPSPSRKPLDCAAENGHMEIVRLLAPIPMPTSRPILVPRSAPVMWEERESYLSRALSASTNNEISQYLVSEGADVNTFQDFDTPLNKAISSKNVALVQFLLAAGADPDRRVPGFEVEVPLFKAANTGSIELIDALLAAGVDPHTRDNASRNVLAFTRDIQLLCLFLELGVDPNHRDSFGSMPLHYTCFLTKDENVNACIELFLKFGATVEAVDYSGRTPVDIAMVADRPAIVEMLEPLVHDPGLKQRIATWKEREGK